MTCSIICEKRRRDGKRQEKQLRAWNVPFTRQQQTSTEARTPLITLTHTHTHSLTHSHCISMCISFHSRRRRRRRRHPYSIIVAACFFFRQKSPCPMRGRRRRKEFLSLIHASISRHISEPASVDDDELSSNGSSAQHSRAKEMHWTLAVDIGRGQRVAPRDLCPHQHQAKGRRQETDGENDDDVVHIRSSLASTLTNYYSLHHASRSRYFTHSLTLSLSLSLCKHLDT